MAKITEKERERLFNRYESGETELFDVLEKECERLLEQNPDDVAARRALAGWLAARGDVDAAVRELQLLLSEHPDDLSARAALGRILLAENRARELMQEYGTLIDALDRRGLLDEAEKLE